jgi:hypothetical protein
MPSAVMARKKATPKIATHADEGWASIYELADKEHPIDKAAIERTKQALTDRTGLARRRPPGRQRKPRRLR